MSLSKNVLVLIENEPRSGSWNMAFDEALLEAARIANLIAVRFYRWNEPTLSLGYFQKELSQALPADLLALPRVRRLSGGGAILHHLEWTYSCVLPACHPLVGEPVRIYEVVHREIVALLNAQGIPAALRGENFPEPGEEPFLCFGRQDPRDIVLGPHKIVGSAQRRRQGAVLQHGSLLLERSPLAPMYPGLLDLSGAEFPITEWISSLSDALSRSFADPEGYPPGPALDELERFAVALERDKYQRENWR